MAAPYRHVFYPRIPSSSVAAIRSGPRASVISSRTHTRSAIRHQFDISSPASTAAIVLHSHGLDITSGNLRSTRFAYGGSRPTQGFKGFQCRIYGIQ